MGTSVAVQTGPSASQMRKLRPTGTEAGTHALPPQGCCLQVPRDPHELPLCPLPHAPPTLGLPETRLGEKTRTFLEWESSHDWGDVENGPWIGRPLSPGAP